jgi:hypothetical protein
MKNLILYTDDRGCNKLLLFGNENETSVAAGENHSLALTDDGRVFHGEEMRVANLEIRLGKMR